MAIIRRYVNLANVDGREIRRVDLSMYKNVVRLNIYMDVSGFQEVEQNPICGVSIDLKTNNEVVYNGIVGLSIYETKKEYSFRFDKETLKEVVFELGTTNNDIPLAVFINIEIEIE